MNRQEQEKQLNAILDIVSNDTIADAIDIIASALALSISLASTAEAIPEENIQALGDALTAKIRSIMSVKKQVRTL